MKFGGIFKGRRVFVTGHTGFKGSWMSQWLLELGAEVCGYSLYLPSNPNHFEVLGLAKSMQSIEGDILDRKHLEKAMSAFNPEIVFHMAAQPIVSTSIQDPVTNYMTNVIGTLNVLEVLRSQSSVQVALMITSDKCYENVEWEFGYRENDRLGGKDPYSASKACAELVFHSHFRTYFMNQQKLKLATVRAGNVIGGGDWAKDRIVPDTVKAWGQGQKPVIRSPRSTRPWQHVLEPLSGYLWLAATLMNRSEGLQGESFNFGPPADVNQSVELLLRELRKTWIGTEWIVEESPLAKKEAGLLKLSCDKALARLAWAPTLKFEETSQFTADWYQSYYKNSPETAKKLTSKQILSYEQLAAERGQPWAQ
jgi:CDP-glucose 4,6-dehydratase